MQPGRRVEALLALQVLAIASRVGLGLEPALGRVRRHAAHVRRRLHGRGRRWRRSARGLGRRTSGSAASACRSGGGSAGASAAPAHAARVRSAAPPARARTAASHRSAASGDIPLTSGGGSGAGGGVAPSSSWCRRARLGRRRGGRGRWAGGGAGCGGGRAAGRLAAAAGADSSQRSAASADIPRTSGVGGEGAAVEDPPPQAQVLVAHAAEAAKGTVRAVPNTAAPTMPGRARIRAMTSSVASREPIAADCEIPRARRSRNVRARAPARRRAGRSAAPRPRRA